MFFLNYTGALKLIMNSKTYEPKWCPQLFLTVIFHQDWVFDFIIQLKSIKIVQVLDLGFD